MHHEHSEPRLILIVERDTSVRELQSYFLGGAGFRVEFVDDGQAALARSRRDPPALLITEILISKIDGLTLCRHLRDDPSTREIPVLVFSILAAAPRAEDAGASAFLRKPFVASSFLATVERVLDAQVTANMEQQ